MPGDKAGRITRRDSIKALAAGTAAVSLSGCTDLLAGDDEDFGDTLRIGVLAPQPNENPVGASIVGGAEIAAQELRDAGGVLGAEEVEVFVEDTQGTGQGGADAYNDLMLDDNVDFTVGNFASEALIGVIDEVPDHEKLHLVAGASTTEMNEAIKDDYDRHKYMFRVGPFNNPTLGQTVVDFAAEFYQDELGWDRTAVLYEEAEWTGLTVERIEDQLGDHGFEVADSIGYSLGTEDFSPIFDDLQGMDIDGVTTVIAHTGVPAVLQWSGGQYDFGFGGIHVPSQFPFMWQELGEAIQYAWTVNFAAPGANITERTGPFLDAYTEEFGMPPVYTGPLAYDAVHLFAEYAEHVGSADADDMVAAIEGNELDLTTSGYETFEVHDRDHEFPHDVVYDKDGWMAGTSAPIYNQWQDGTLETIQPGAHATADYQQPHWI